MRKVHLLLTQRHHGWTWIW